MNASIPRNWTDGNVARVRIVSRAWCTGPPSRNIEYQPDCYKKRPWQSATLQPRAAEGNGSSPPSRIQELRRFSAKAIHVSRKGRARYLLKVADVNSSLPPGAEALKPTTVRVSVGPDVLEPLILLGSFGADVTSIASLSEDALIARLVSKKESKTQSISLAGLDKTIRDSSRSGSTLTLTVVGLRASAPGGSDELTSATFSR
jgi:hypothetical protein